MVSKRLTLREIFTSLAALILFIQRLIMTLISPSDPRKRLYPAWGLSVLLVLVGSGCSGLFFHQAIPDSILLLIIGLSCVLLGMLTMVLSALKVLSDDTSLLWTQTGVIYRDQDARRTELEWRDITHFQCEKHLHYIELTTAADYRLKLHLHSMRLDPEVLCSVLREEQRKALMGVKLRGPKELRLLKLPVSAGGEKS